MSFNIAIDGPAGAGKSTIAKRVAKELNFIYVDTGAMYRAMALFFQQNQIDPKDEEAVSDACEGIVISISYEEGQQRILLNGENVTGLLRREEIGNMASIVSGYPAVRKTLLSLQQDLARTQDVIMDGRDIGTCVLPDAPLKIYLTASVETRGQRRYQELKEKGAECDLEEICGDIAERDRRDMEREISPLRQAEDALLIDSSHMNVEEVTAAILQYAKERGA